MTIYSQGANIERNHCKRAIREGALVSLRGAGSKSYGPYKIDTIDIFPDKIRVTQHKKRGHIAKTQIVKLLELQRKCPSNVEIYIGDTGGLKHINECVKLLFK